MGNFDDLAAHEREPRIVHAVIEGTTKQYTPSVWCLIGVNTSFFGAITDVRFNLWLKTYGAEERREHINSLSQLLDLIYC